MAGKPRQPRGHLLPFQRERIDASNRAARRSRCRRCGAAVLVGLDADRVAAVATVDPVAVGRVTETAALLAGVRSYNFIRGNLYIREPHHTGQMQYESGRQENKPEPELEQPIHLEHSCSKEKDTLW